MGQQYDQKISVQGILDDCKGSFGDSRMDVWIEEFIKNSYKFYLGEIRTIPDLKTYDPVLANLPYPMTYMEFDAMWEIEAGKWLTTLGPPKDNFVITSFRQVCMAWVPTDQRDIDRGVRFSFRELGRCGYKTTKETSTRTTPNTYQTDVSVVDGEIRVVTHPSKFTVSPRLPDPAFLREMEELAYKIMSVNSILKCKNIAVQRVEPPEKLNRAREKKGKRPFMRYHVLSITPTVRTVNICTGIEGQRSSPCFHWRRGHVREYRPGAYTYVTASAIGTVERGVVDKDYRLLKEAKKEKKWPRDWEQQLQDEVEMDAKEAVK